MNGLIIGFKESEAERLKAEFPFLYPKLIAFLLVANYYLNLLFKEYITVTHIRRIQEEQDGFYADKIAKGKFIEIDGVKHYSKDGKKLTLSKHQLEEPQAVDIRTKDYGKEIIDFIIELQKKYFPDLLIRKDDRGVKHFHIEKI